MLQGGGPPMWRQHVRPCPHERPALLPGLLPPRLCRHARTGAAAAGAGGRSTAGAQRCGVAICCMRHAGPPPLHLPQQRLVSLANGTASGPLAGPGAQLDYTGVKLADPGNATKLWAVVWHTDGSLWRFPAELLSFCDLGLGGSWRRLACGSGSGAGVGQRPAAGMGGALSHELPAYGLQACPSAQPSRAARTAGRSLHRASRTTSAARAWSAPTEVSQPWRRLHCACRCYRRLIKPSQQCPAAALSRAPWVRCQHASCSQPKRNRGFQRWQRHV